MYCSHLLQPWLDLAAIIPWPSTATCIVHTFFCHQFIQPRITADWICNPYVIQASRNLNYNGRTVVVQTRYIFEWYIFTGFTQWTFSVFGQAYLPIVGKHYFMHISKRITGFSRWTLGVFGRPYWVVVGKYYLTHISKLITGFRHLGVFGRPYWVVVGKYYLMWLPGLADPYWVYSAHRIG